MFLAFLFKRFYSGDKTSIKEEFTKRVLEQLFNNREYPESGLKFDSVWPEWLKSDSDKPLELDIYNEELSVAFEMNGPYHNDPKLIAKMFGISLQEAIIKVNKVQKNDRKKVAECKKHRLDLFVLNYNMDYEEIVKFCCKYYVDKIKSENPSEKINWKDLDIKWEEILADVRKTRIEQILTRFDYKRVKNLTKKCLDEEFEDF